MLERIELAHAIPGEKLFTKPLVNSVMKILDTTYLRRTEGTVTSTFYYLRVGSEGRITLVQENKQDSPESDLLAATLFYYPRLFGATILMSSISRIETSPNSKSVFFVIESPAFKQSIYIKNTGEYSSSTTSR